MRRYRILLCLLVFVGCLPALAPAFGQDSAPEPTSQQINKLVRDLKSSNSETRFSAADALGSMGSSAASAAPRIAECLKDAHEEVRFGAVETLRKIGDSAASAVPRLVELLEDKRNPYRSDAADALGAIGPSAASSVPALANALKDKEEDVRSSSSRALAAMGPDAAFATPALMEALNDKSDTVRADAAYALGMVGSRDAAAAPALVKLLNDKESGVRYSTLFALAALAGDGEKNLKSMDYSELTRAAANWESVQNNLDSRDDKSEIHSEEFREMEPRARQLALIFQKEKQGYWQAAIQTAIRAYSGLIGGVLALVIVVSAGGIVFVKRKRARRVSNDLQ